MTAWLVLSNFIKKSMEMMKSTKTTTLQSRISLPKEVLSVNFFILKIILYY